MDIDLHNYAVSFFSVIVWWRTTLTCTIAARLRIVQRQAGIYNSGAIRTSPSEVLDIILGLRLTQSTIPIDASAHATALRLRELGD